MTHRNPHQWTRAGMLLLMAGLLVQGAQEAGAQQPPSAVFTEVSLVQKLGDQAPLETAFCNEQGEAVTLGALLPQ